MNTYRIGIDHKLAITAKADKSKLLLQQTEYNA